VRDLPGVISANLPGAIRGSRAGRRIVSQWHREGRTLPPTPGDPHYPAPYAKHLSPRRTFAARSFSLPRIRALGRSHGVTINDVFLATLAGAIRDLLREQTGTASSAPMVATVPFALVPLEQRTRDGNFSTTCHTLLHTEVEDPVERLAACKRDADTMKTYFEATREANLTAVLNLLPPLVPKLVERINEMKGGGLLPFWNVVVSNVPGPRAPLQLGHLKLEQWFSIGQIAHGATLNVTGWSYLDQFNLSVLADPTVLDDAWRLVDRFEASLVELETVAPGA
jgi:diacylglycerol O-acyltransferase